ncbi:MAG: ABC transporter permease [Phycisphaerae bacterium]
MSRRLLRNVWPPAVLLLGAVAAIEALVQLDVLPGQLVPAPSAVLHVLFVDLVRQRLHTAVLETALAAAGGLALSTVIGLATGMLVAGSDLARRALYPYVVVLQTLPIIAIAPLLAIWVGYDLRSIVLTACLASLFPVVAASVAGLRSTDPALLDLFRLHQAGFVATLWKLRLPGALPQIFTGLRVAAGLSVIGAIVGEFVLAGGLGRRIIAAVSAGNEAVVFAAVILASGLGVMFFGLINLAAWLTLRRWYAGER